MNLLEKPGGVETVNVSPGRYSMQLLNPIPLRQYTYTTLLRTRQVPPLDASVLTLPPPATATPGVPASAPPGCAALEDATKTLTEAADEPAAADPDRRAALKKALDNAPSPPCDPQVRARAALALADVVRTLDEQFTLMPGQVLEITISRGGPDGKSRAWTKSFDAGERGQWRTSYGFAFVQNRDEHWFSKAGEAGKFTLTRKAERQNFDFAPSVFFTWVPSWKISSDLDIGPTAGLGFDLSAPVVFAGISLFWNENVAFVGGLVMHQRERLAGEYQSGQTVEENLASDKLVEKTYGPGGFLGLTFRFGTRPKGFGKGVADAPQGER